MTVRIDIVVENNTGRRIGGDSGKKRERERKISRDQEKESD